MAREFNGSNEYLGVASAAITGVPFAIAAWFNADVLQMDGVLVSIVDVSEGDEFFALGIGWEDYGSQAANSNIQAITRSPNRDYSNTTTAYSINSCWYQIVQYHLILLDERRLYSLRENFL